MRKRLRIPLLIAIGFPGAVQGCFNTESGFEATLNRKATDIDELPVIQPRVPSSNPPHTNDTSSGVPSNIEAIKQRHGFDFNLHTEPGWRTAISTLSSDAGAVKELVDLYGELERDGSPGTIVARYEVVMVLSRLPHVEAIADLDRIARSPLPQGTNPAYLSELDVRYRAIDGLGHLRAVDQLRNIYATGTSALRPAAGAALLKAGERPSGVAMVPTSVLPTITPPACREGVPCKSSGGMTP